MPFHQIWLRGVRDLFTWEGEQTLSPGARVVVKFRGKKRVGLVVSSSAKKPTFRTQPVLEIWDESFLPPKFISLAQEIATEFFTPLPKILGLMVPEKFLIQKHPEKRETFYTLTGEEFESLRGEKQKWVVEQLLKQEKVSEETLRKKVSLQTLRSLEEKKIITSLSGKIIPAVLPREKVRQNFTLNAAQQGAFEQISKSSKPSVLFGVTGSGKTEIYKKLAKAVSESDPTAQVLFLLPEIALTPQLVAEFRAQVGEQVAVWHSNLSAGEKIQEWARCRSGEARILIGARSAAWVPLVNPKLIILDEEHEWTFKSEFAPRIWTHELVERLAQRFQAKRVFGSATPRLESFWRCESGEWDLISLVERVHAVEMPDIQFVDLRNEGKKGNFTPISEWLGEEISDMLKQKKQGILFLNRRGFSGSTMCRKCGHNFHCPHCSSPMKLHRNFDREKMLCHVCGHLEKVSEHCPECGEKNFEFRGWGTQQVEQILGDQFPGIRVLRADADSVGGRYDFEKILDTFHRGEADILLGTQMIAKGLDFENVNLVGVILADVGLGLPDFRADERVFQLLTQVAGRAGRRKKQGKILIQTFRPDEEIFQFVRNHDTQHFVAKQLCDRKVSQMPPFVSLAKVTFSHPDKKRGWQLSKHFFQQAREAFGSQAQWAPAFFPKAHGKYHFHVFLRASSRQKLQEFFQKTPLPHEAKIDLDPVSLL